MRSGPIQIPEIRLPITDQKMQILRSFLNRFVDFVGKSLFGNIKTSEILTMVFAGAAENTTIHNLGRVPYGFLVINLSAVATITGVTAKWTTSTITLAASAACTIRIVVL